jgi:PncC family amidohydrolase
LGKRLQENGLTISVAESCTGGLLASRITDVAGASAYFLGGVIAYQNEVKKRLLAVPSEVLADTGAVSEEVALAMARGCRELFGSDIGVSITGIAGPTGGNVEKPVGLMYIAVITPAAGRCERYHWAGNRISNKENSVRAALEVVISLLEDDDPSSVETTKSMR